MDAGCGPGFYVTELLARGAEVVGCAASAHMIDVARTMVGNPADLQVHALEEPFDWIETSSVDVAVSALVYHYINHRLGFLREMHRVLRPNGVLVISTHHPTADCQRLAGSYFAVEPVTETLDQGLGDHPLRVLYDHQLAQSDGSPHGWSDFRGHPAHRSSAREPMYLVALGCFVVHRRRVPWK